MSIEYAAKDLTTQANFAKLCGVSPEAIRKAGDIGKITVIGEGRAKRIVITAQNTIDYLNDRNSQRKTGTNAENSENHIKTRKTEKGGGDKGENTENMDEKSENPAVGFDINTILDLDELEVDIKLLSINDVNKLKGLESARRTAIERKKSRNELIERKLVSAVLGKIYTVEVNQIKTIADKTPAKIAAIYENNDSAKTAKVSELLSSEISNALKHIQTILEKFLLDINNGHHGGLNV